MTREYNPDDLRNSAKFTELKARLLRRLPRKGAGLTLREIFEKFRRVDRYTLTLALEELEQDREIQVLWPTPQFRRFLRATLEPVTVPEVSPAAWNSPGLNRPKARKIYPYGAFPKVFAE